MKEASGADELANDDQEKEKTQGDDQEKDGETTVQKGEGE